jgi:hypothetical protein
MDWSGFIRPTRLWRLSYEGRPAEEEALNLFIKISSCSQFYFSAEVVQYISTANNVLCTSYVTQEKQFVLCPVYCVMVSRLVGRNCSGVGWSRLSYGDICGNNVFVRLVTSVETCSFCVYTECFTTLGHNCRRWFPRSLWSKKFI